MALAVSGRRCHTLHYGDGCCVAPSPARSYTEADASGWRRSEGAAVFGGSSSAVAGTSIEAGSPPVFPELRLRSSHVSLGRPKACSPLCFPPIVVFAVPLSSEFPISRSARIVCPVSVPLLAVYAAFVESASFLPTLFWTPAGNLCAASAAVSSRHTSRRPPTEVMKVDCGS